MLFDPSLPLVRCFAGEINQVPLNLVINAVHAIADERHTDGAQTGQITISTCHQRDWAEVSIADAGACIRELVLDRVFDPFFTTKESGEETGQGLMLARALVMKKHEGQSWFDTEDGKATTFFVRLPTMTARED